MSLDLRKILQCALKSDEPPRGWFPERVSDTTMELCIQTINGDLGALKKLKDEKLLDDYTEEQVYQLFWGAKMLLRFEKGAR